MRFSGRTLSLLLTATAVAASVFQQGSPATSRNGLEKRSLFGVVKSSNGALTNPLVVPRGGSDSEDAEQDVPEVLYLPGLLSATVAKKIVSFFLVIVIL